MDQNTISTKNSAAPMKSEREKRTGRFHAAGKYATKDWDEKVLQAYSEQQKLNSARVTNLYQGNLEGQGAMEGLLLYVGEIDGSFFAFERIEGKLGGRTGTFIMQHQGVFTPSGVETIWTVVPGSGTGELTGLRGQGSLSSKYGKADYPYTLDYDFD